MAQPGPADATEPDLTAAPADDEPPVPEAEHQHNAEAATDGAEEMAWR